MADIEEVHGVLMQIEGFLNDLQKYVKECQTKAETLAKGQGIETLKELRDKIGKAADDLRPWPF